MDRKKLALEIIERLKTEYPGAPAVLTTIRHGKLLVSVRLAGTVYGCKSKSGCKRII